MNADPSRAGAGGEDNSWETLAEDLFGIDLGADPSREPLVVPEDLALDEPESSAPEVKAAPEKSVPTPAAGKHESAAASPEKRPSREEKRPQRRSPPPARPSMRDEDDFGADLDLDEPTQPQSRDADFEGEFEIEEEIIPEDKVGSEQGAGDSATDESPALGAEKSDSSEEDPYWDTLKTWQWSEEEGEPGEHSENRGRPGQRGGRGGGGPRRPGGRERSGGRERRPPQGGSRPPRSEGRSEARGEGRREERPPSRRTEAPPDRSRRQPPPPPPRNESEETDDFGAGLVEEQPLAKPARGGREPWDADSRAEGRPSREEFAEPDDVHESEEGAEPVEQTGAERPPRRRRRRRRSRSRKEQPGEPMERQESSGPKDEAEFEEQSADESVSEEGNTEEAGVETEESEGGAPRRRRRRRRPGDRGPRREPLAEQPLTDAEADEAFPAESRLDASSDDVDEDEEGVEVEGDAESDDEAPRVYRNVPTWEEAISFLLHRRPGDSRPREGESGGPREFRREGGRRPPPDRGERSHD